MHEYLLDSELDLVYTEVMAATHPEDVFGSPAKQLPLREQQAALQQRFEELKKLLDPEQYTRVVDANAASDAYDKLAGWYREAKAGLVTGQSLMNFTVRETEYQVGERIAYGHHSVIHRAIATTGTVSEEVAMKIAKDSTHSQVLAIEAAHVRAFHSTSGHNPVRRITRVLPKLLDTFEVEGRRVNVLPYYAGYRSVEEIDNYFRGELPVGHAAWIARRLLAFPLNAALAGLRHQAIDFGHLLVHPITHEPIYLGWGEAVPVNRTETDLTHLYLRDTFVKVLQLFQTERGGCVDDTPPKLWVYLQQQARHDQRVDATHVFTEFTELIYETLGKKYRPLTLN